MYLPVFDWVKNDPDVVAVLGSPPRVYLFGEAEPGIQGVYAVWQSVAGAPENYLGDGSDADELVIQFDVYAPTVNECRAAVTALATALEPHGYVVGWGAEDRDRDTRYYRKRFDFSAWLSRKRG